MFFEKMVSRLRAAHALAFAMSARQTPQRADLERIGLDGVNMKLFDFQEMRRAEARRSHRTSPLK